jgi:hypothetical protein
VGSGPGAPIVYAIMATSASASIELPDLHVLPTETYPLHLEVTYLTNSRFENAGSEGLESRESEGGSVLLLFLITAVAVCGMRGRVIDLPPGWWRERRRH